MASQILRGLRPIYVQVLIAIFIASIVGMIWPDVGRAMKQLGDGFIALLTIMIGPSIFTTVVTGLTQIRDTGRLGRVLVKSFIYFEVVSTIALLLGMVAANVMEPGAGLHAGKEITPAIAGFQSSAAKAGGFVEFLLAIIPKTFVSPFAEGEILQILIISVMFGTAALLVGDKAKQVISIVAEVQKISFRMLSFIMYLAPLGAFGAMAYTVGLHGGATLVSLLNLILLVYACCIFFVFVILGAIAGAFGFNILSILRMVREEFLLVLNLNITLQLCVKQISM